MMLRGLRQSQGQRVRSRRRRVARERHPAPESGRSAADSAAPRGANIPNASLNVTDRARGSAQIIGLHGALDLHSVGLLEEVVARVWTPATTAITLDLSGLTFIDSCGLWTITTVNKWCGRGNVPLDLIPGPEAVHSVFELTGLSDVLPFGNCEAHRSSADDRGR